MMLMVEKLKVATNFIYLLTDSIAMANEPQYKSPTVHCPLYDGPQ